MSDTPETDDQPIIYAMNDNGYQVPCVDLEFCTNHACGTPLSVALRERDEAHALLDTASDRIEQLNGLCNLLRDERDILRSNKMSDPLLETTFKHLNRERDEACQVANGLAKQVERLRKQRDEARAERDILRLDAQREAEHHDRMVGELEKVYKERDEARAAIPAGEWVAYKDHQKVHDAASRLLVAINKQLPIGCFILINSEYHRLQNAIYGRESAK
jgi:hypothetical protein